MAFSASVATGRRVMGYGDDVGWWHHESKQQNGGGGAATKRGVKRKEKWHQHDRRRIIYPRAREQ